jgi:hypothetical protein
VEDFELAEGLQSAFALANHFQFAVGEAPAGFAFPAELDDDLEFTAGCDDKAFFSGGLDLDNVISLKHGVPQVCMMHGTTLGKIESVRISAATEQICFADEVPVES